VNRSAQAVPRTGRPAQLGAGGRKLASGGRQICVPTDRRHDDHSCRSRDRNQPRTGAGTAGARVARYYDPTTAQFLTRDPIESITRSPYGYVAGDPLDGADPSGLCWGPRSLCDYLTQAGESWTATVDSLTGGATRWARHELGIDDSCTVNSDAYQATQQLWLGPPGVTRDEILPPEDPEAALPKAAAPEVGNLSSKIQRQMESRGWTKEQIQEAYGSGGRVNAVNKANGNPATRYINPTTGQSVVVDDVTGEVIHVGGPGFLYGSESGDLP